jgi:murein L,D-transpeptidase YcbB/YkuD
LSGLILLLGGQADVSAGDPTMEVARLIRNRIEAAGQPARIMVGEEKVHSSVSLPLFYSRRVFQPAWVTDGTIPQRATDLRAKIQQATLEGLNPLNYHLRKIDDLVAGVERASVGERAGLCADVDILLTDAFLIYGSHLLSGAINPETLDPEWLANRREGDMAAILQSALEREQVPDVLAGLAPSHAGYAGLKNALRRYTQIAGSGGWPMVPEGEALKKGARETRVAVLRQRLRVEGFHTARAMQEEEYFGDRLDQAVRRYQELRGLNPDGIVGRETLTDLNISVKDRIKQILVNLERWRWLPDDLGPRYFLINIANYDMKVVESGRTLKTVRVVVGKSYRRTPVFSGLMTYLVLNPYWHVPHKLAVEDILPQVQRDPDYLAANRFRVFSGWGGDAREIDPQTIDWPGLSKRNFPYRLRQDPGPANSLGRVKFMFPNKYNVYLHDTPARALFSRPVRAFSSGCIRVEDPLGLAGYLLKDTPRWNPVRLSEILESEIDFTVKLPAPIPVHLEYWTAWVGSDEQIHFRKDIYTRDAILEAAMVEANLFPLSVVR